MHMYMTTHAFFIIYFFYSYFLLFKLINNAFFPLQLFQLSMHMWHITNENNRMVVFLKYMTLYIDTQASVRYCTNLALRHEITLVTV